MTNSVGTLLIAVSVFLDTASGSGVSLWRPRSSQRSGLRDRVSETVIAPRILVMPFENVAREAPLFWLTEAAAVLLTDDLNALGASAITRMERQQAFERLQVPPDEVLTDATVIRIGQLVGAAQVIVGFRLIENDAIDVRARIISHDTGRVCTDVTDCGPLPDLSTM